MPTLVLLVSTPHDIEQIRNQTTVLSGLFESSLPSAAHSRIPFPRGLQLDPLASGLLPSLALDSVTVE